MPPRKKKVEVPKPVVEAVVEKPKRQIENKPNHVNFYSYCQNLVRIEKLDASLAIHADVIKQVLKKIKLTDDTKHPVVYQVELVRDQDPKFYDPYELLNLENDPDLQLLVDKVDAKDKPIPQEEA